MKMITFLLYLLFALAINGCQQKETAKNDTSQTAEKPKGGEVKQQGQASWYGPDFHGKATATGEIYNQNAMTAASKTLPLGSTAKVTNTETGKSVDVRINDRGPYVGSRVLDLSKAAAEKIDLTDKGVSHVKIVAKKPAKKAKNIKRKLAKKANNKQIARD